MPFTRSPFTCTSGRPFRALKKPIKGSRSVERGYFLLMRAVLLAALAAGVLAANDDGHRGGKPLTAQESGFKAGNDYHVNEQQLGANASIPSWRTIQEAYLDAMSAFRWTDSGPGLGMYRDSIGFDGGSGAHPMSSTFSISGTGFGLVGLCVSAKLGHTTMSRARSVVM